MKKIVTILAVLMMTCTMYAKDIQIKTPSGKTVTVSDTAKLRKGTKGGTYYWVKSKKTGTIYKHYIK